MHTIFIAFISFVSYATGVVTIRRWVREEPTGAVDPVEALLALGVVVCSVSLRKPHYSAKYVALCALGMSFAGLVVGSAMLLRTKRSTAGTREYEQERASTGNVNLWRRWLNASRAVADYEFRLMLLGCYLIIVGPLAVAFRMGRRKNAGDGGAPAWVPRSDADGMEAARRPF